MFFAILTMFFGQFAYNLVDTWTWYRRIVSCEKRRHDVMTSPRSDVITSILAVSFKVGVANR